MHSCCVHHKGRVDNERSGQEAETGDCQPTEGTAHHGLARERAEERRDPGLSRRDSPQEAKQGPLKEPTVRMGIRESIEARRRKTFKEGEGTLRCVKCC